MPRLSVASLTACSLCHKANPTQANSIAGGSVATLDISEIGWSQAELGSPQRLLLITEAHHMQVGARSNIALMNIAMRLWPTELQEDLLLACITKGTLA